MGASAPYLDEVRQQAAKLPFKATVSVNVRDMAERMCLADLSIGAVGSTSWERCCLGLPAILIVLAENQKSAAVALKKSGAVIITDSGVAVRAELEQLMKVDFCMISLIKMANLGAAMVDGDGCINIVSELAARSYEF
jgi:spore coat polysaccharide biosynthesis predicted glycosyltransferase SpsG